MFRIPPNPFNRFVEPDFFHNTPLVFWKCQIELTSLGNLLASHGIVLWDVLLLVLLSSKPGKKYPTKDKSGKTILKKHWKTILPLNVKPMARAAYQPKPEGRERQTCWSPPFHAPSSDPSLCWSKTLSVSVPARTWKGRNENQQHSEWTEKEEMK